MSTALDVLVDIQQCQPKCPPQNSKKAYFFNVIYIYFTVVFLNADSRLR